MKHLVFLLLICFGLNARSQTFDGVMLSGMYDNFFNDHFRGSTFGIHVSAKLGQGNDDRPHGPYFNWNLSLGNTSDTSFLIRYSVGPIFGYFTFMNSYSLESLGLAFLMVLLPEGISFRFPVSEKGMFEPWFNFAGLHYFVKNNSSDAGKLYYSPEIGARVSLSPGKFYFLGVHGNLRYFLPDHYSATWSVGFSTGFRL